jgi:UDP-N-acetylglucosamine acyltransferase
MPQISQRAVVEPGARLADDAQVGPFAYVGPEAVLGPGCIVDAGASVMGRTTLGAKCRVFPLAAVGTAPPGADRPGQCILGQANTVREHATVYAGADPPTRIGNDNLIMIGCLIGPGATVGDHGIFTNYTQINGPSVIEDYVRTSAFATVAAGSRVGAYSFLAGYTGINGAVPPFAMVQGCPSRVRGVNTENLRRCGFGDDDIRALRDAFRQLFNGSTGQPDDKLVRKLLAQKELNHHVRRMLESTYAPPGPGSPP